VSAIIGALVGINMISGAGMLDFLACHSIEKLVMDAEAIASAQRLLSGIDFQDKSLAAAMFAQTGLSGDFLKLKETRALFRLHKLLTAQHRMRTAPCRCPIPSLDPAHESKNCFAPISAPP
jgi:trimethylamine--corrinoid protein Co-methyltransferase